MNSSLTALAVPHPRLGLSAATVIEANGVPFAKKKDTLLAHICATSSKLRCYGLLTLLKDFFFKGELDSPFKVGVGGQSQQKNAEMCT